MYFLLEKEKLRNNIIKKISSRIPLFEIITLICICANVIHTHTSIMGIHKWYYVIYPTSHICFILFDGLLLYFVSYIIPKYRKNILLMAYFIGTILLWVNVAYSRDFNTYLPTTLYNEFSNLKGLLPNIIVSFEYNDFFYIITSTLTLFTFYIDKTNMKHKHNYYLFLSRITPFVSLAKTQIKTFLCQMIIPTENDAWSQNAIYGKYGIDLLYSQEGYNKERKNDWLNDKQLFDYASDISHSFQTPFISIIQTSSTHSPYNKSYEETTIKYPDAFSKELKHYLDNIHYMDKHLFFFIETINAFTWFKETTKNITAEHKPNGPKLNTNEDYLFSEIPIIVFHPPYEYKGIKDDKTISQTTVFPTILDLFNINSNWRGGGQSIFMPNCIINFPYEIERQKLSHIYNIDYTI